MNLADPLCVAEAPARRIPLAIDIAERVARLRLARSENVGPRTFLHLIGRFGSATNAAAALPALAARGGRPHYVPFPAAAAEAEIERGEAAGASLVMLGDADYPARLLTIDTPPPMLWIRGDRSVFSRPAVAIVGARNASALGQRTARRLARELGEAGRLIVSGLARGIDTAAHEGSVATGTIAALAGGVDRIYPEENADLAARIAAEGGAILSECAPGIEPTSRHFPRRNRLISGLSDGVLLIEAAIRSGSLITARAALEQGREVMACPGAPDDPRAAGCNALIRDGAALVRSATDVLEALETVDRPRLKGLAEGGGAFEFDFDADDFADSALRDDYDALADFDMDEAADDSTLVEQILALLGPEPVEIDEVARACGARPSELSLALLELDIAGRVDLLPGGLVARGAEG